MASNTHQSDPTKLKATVTQLAKDRTVTGSVTADAGTNLNTSALATSAKQLADDHNVTVSNQISGFATEAGGNLASIKTNTDDLSSIKTAVEILDNFISGTKGLVTEDNSADIETAVQKIDNQEDEITYDDVNKLSTDGDIIAAPGVGHHLRIHHIFVMNGGANLTIFYIRNGSAGEPKFAFGLAKEGGCVAQNFKRPWGLSTNTALYYDYNSGTSPNISITVGYEDITD